MTDTDTTTTGPYTRSVTSMLRHWASERPNAPMLTEDDRSLTWGEFYDRASRVANALAGDGVVPGDRVAFLDRNGIEYFEVLFGCALLGAVSVAVNWRLAPLEMAGIVEDAGAVVLFYGSDYEAAVKEFTSQVASVRLYVTLDGFAGWRDGPDRERAGDPGFEPGPDDVVTQLY